MRHAEDDVIVSDGVEAPVVELEATYRVHWSDTSGNDGCGKSYMRWSDAGSDRTDLDGHRARLYGSA